MEENKIIIYKTSDGKASVSLYAKDGELEKFSVIKNYFTTASDGKQYNETFCSLEMNPVLDKKEFIQFISIIVIRGK